MIPNICQHLQAEGFCTDSSCKRNHDLNVCNDCGIFCTSASAYRAHLGGKRHKNRGSTSPFHCSICDSTIFGPTAWDHHLSGVRHRKCATRKGVSADVQPVTLDTVSGHVYCGICDRHIPRNSWSHHPQNPLHLKKQKVVAFKTVLEEAVKDKHGIIVSEDVDFGIVDVQRANQGVIRTLTIQNTVPSAQITIVKAKLSSSSSIKSNPSFFVGSAPTSAQLKCGKSISVAISFQQAYNGRYEDRLELVFEDKVLHQQFVIVRLLKGVVGDVIDHELLKPVAPFKPPNRKRTNELPVCDIIPGVRPPAVFAIPYVIKLPKAQIPDLLMSAMSTGTSSEVLKRVVDAFLPGILNSNTFGRHFKNLLWIEEYRMERDLQMYDILDAKLDKTDFLDISRRGQAVDRRNAYYYLGVPGLAEKRPSVIIGDQIFVQPHGGPEGKWYEGWVHVVQKERVGLRFNRSFQGWTSQQRYNVRFRLNRIPLRRQHQALDSALISDRILFPQTHHILPPRVLEGISPYNRLIASNPAQLLAITSILEQSPGSPPFMLFGPPGTGKTITVVESIRQLLDHHPDACILATAPSNSAADLIASRLASALDTNEMFRMYAPSRSKVQVPIELQPYTFVKDGLYSIPAMEEFLEFKVVISTCVSASICHGVGVARGHFTHLFVDEAGHATEPEVMIMIKTMADNNSNVVLSGDPKQLGPIIRSGVARELGLDISYIERLMTTEAYDMRIYTGTTVVKLVKNFRSHKIILQFPNERFYGNDLEPCADRKIANAMLGSSQLATKYFPIVFHAVHGRDQQEASSPSFFNIDEITQVKTYVEALRADRLYRATDDDIGIIAPYHAQCLKLRAALRAVADSIKVGSVEEFQGQERKIIIVSTVRSNRDFVGYDLKHTLGFVANPRRFNVAVTRAQALLIIVGDPNVLSLDPLWRSFLNFIHNGGGWRGPPITWDPQDEVSLDDDLCGIVREGGMENMNRFTRRMEILTYSMAQPGDEEIDEADINIDRPWKDNE